MTLQLLATRADKGVRYLWPNYSEDSSNFHVLLIVLISNVKSREKLPTWGENPRLSWWSAC